MNERQTFKLAPGADSDDVLNRIASADTAQEFTHAIHGNELSVTSQTDHTPEQITAFVHSAIGDVLEG